MFIWNIIGKILFPNDLAGNRLKSLKRRMVINKHNIRLRTTTTCFLFNFVWLITCWCKIIRFKYWKQIGRYIFTKKFHLIYFQSCSNEGNKQRKRFVPRKKLNWSKTQWNGEINFIFLFYNGNPTKYIPRAKQATWQSKKSKFHYFS